MTIFCWIFHAFVARIILVGLQKDKEMQEKERKVQVMRSSNMWPSLCIHKKWICWWGSEETLEIGMWRGGSMLFSC